MEPKLCPLLMAALLVGNGERLTEKLEQGWDRCQGIDCAWWTGTGCVALAPRTEG
jgi:hypothetical protein